MNRPAVLLVAVLLTACSGVGSGAFSGSMTDVSPQTEPSVARAQNSSRTLIRRAELALDVPRLDRALVHTSRVVSAAGGSVEREAIADRSAHLVIRVPETNLAATSDSLSVIGKVTHRSLSTDDASARAINLEARIVALTASRDRLRALIDRANTVEEVIVVERELARVQAELENLEGQQRHLRDAAAMATLGLSLEQPPKLGPIGLVAKGATLLIGKLFVLD
jgi:hypothetical protein